MYFIRKINNLSEISKDVLIGLIISVAVVTLTSWLIIKSNDGTLGESVSQLIGFSITIIFTGLSVGYIDNSKE